REHRFRSRVALPAGALPRGRPAGFPASQTGTLHLRAIHLARGAAAGAQADGIAAERRLDWSVHRDYARLATCRTTWRLSCASVHWRTRLASATRVYLPQEFNSTMTTVRWSMT